MQRSTQLKRKTSRRWTGLGQLSLVEHSLCPLDPGISLVENLVHQSAYFFVDKNQRLQKASARIVSPSGLSATDEFYLWGLLALTFAQPQADANLHATPHYCLRQLGAIDQHSRRGGRQYAQFANAIERLSQVTYMNDGFYDPVRAEHRKVSFGFLSYSLPLDPESHRAWRIAWDPIFFELVQAAGGSFRFDLATYRELDAATRRLFLLLSKILHRRPSSPRFDVHHLAVNVLGFSSSLHVRDLKVKLWRCAERLSALDVVRLRDKEASFRKDRSGKYSVIFERGSYFDSRSRTEKSPLTSESSMHELLRHLGFDDAAACRLIRRFPMAMLREWVDIALFAKEHFEPQFFKKSPQAFLVDNLNHAIAGKRTPPDWWHEARRTENLRLKAGREAGPNFTVSEALDVPHDCRAAYEQIARDMFASFIAGGQPAATAKLNAEKFARECVARGGPEVESPFLRLLKAF